MASEDIFAAAEIEENVNLDCEETEEIAIDDVVEDGDEIEQQNNNELITEQESEEQDDPNISTITKHNTISVNNLLNKEKSVLKTIQEPKLIQLPLARIRGLMKLDPDLQIVSNEAVFAVTKATEMFIESLAREAYTFTAQAKKKTIQKRDVDLAFTSVDSLMFLEGAMNFD